MEILITLLILFGLLGCNSQVTNVGPDITSKLQRVYTGKATNDLSVEIQGEDPYEFVVSGVGVTTQFPLGKQVLLKGKKTIAFSYSKVGTYSVVLVIKRPDGVEIAEDTLAWEYNTVKPLKPIVSFDELATKDDNVNLLLASAIGSTTNEIWVQGDLKGAKAKGYWSKIPESLRLPIEVSSVDGTKTLKIKYRNIYGNESETIEISIVRDSVKPTNCQAIIPAATVNRKIVRLYMSGEDELDLLYSVSGEASELTDQRFTENVETNVILSDGLGKKKVTVTVFDIAKNECLTQEIEITVDEDYQPITMQVEDDPLWTDDPNAVLLNKYDAFPHETIEMRIWGEVSFNESMEWQPFAESYPLVLSGSRGGRTIFAKFRKGAFETSTMEYSLYLKPKVVYRTNEVHLDELYGLRAVTILGCNETYTEVDYQGEYPCTPTGGSIQAIYHLEDGTEVARSTDV